MTKIAVICVLRHSKDFNAQYVDILFKSILRNSTHDLRLICISDVNAPHSINFQNNWSGWWSKIELFQFDGPVIYFDLDTVIVGDLTPFYDLIKSTTERKLFMLKPFGKHERMASGIMAWTGDWSRLYDNFDYEKHSKQFRGDQDYIADAIKPEDNVDFIQNHISGIYSYKYHCRPKLPNDARIVCFHGHPRPHEAQHQDWVKRNWRI
jgi:hypothetical protein